MEQELPQPKSLPSASEILKEAWDIYKANVVKFIYLAIIPFGLLLPSIFFGQTSPGIFGLSFIQGPGILIVLWILLMVLAILAQLLFILSLVFIIRERQLNPGPKETLKYAWGQLASYVWIWFLTGIFVLAGMILFIIPGILMAIWYSLVIYVLVAEGKKGTQALKRSKELVKGYWWKVLWRLIIIGIVVAIPVLPFSLLADWAQKVNLITLEIGAGILTLMISFLIQGLSSSYGFLLYEKLKGIKESRINIQV